ncbi:hypothetical protein E9993_14765 [Labilibacter sediminis]|nr:hypothetical protein E9993_14765 [Labilibacter sediminis]
MSEKYTVNIKVKPYVKQYLINNCGDPCDLSLLPEVHKEFLRYLSKPLFTRESLPASTQNDDLCIEIPEWIFKQYGWELTQSGQLDFNTRMEKRLKFIMRTWIGHRTAIGFTIAETIRGFQNKFNFPEDVWSYEAIKKDLYRNTECEKSNTVENFLKKLDIEMQQQFVNNLSATGTISKKWKHELSQIE